MCHTIRVLMVTVFVTTAIWADRTARAVTVDNFNEGPFSIHVAAFSWAENTQSGLQEENVVGGARYVKVSNIHGHEPASADGGSGDTILSFFGQGTIHSYVEFRYGGEPTLNRDLTAGGQNAFQITVTDADAGGALDLEVETHVGESNYTQKIIPFQEITNVGNYIFAFDEFSGPGGISDFTDVDAISVFLKRTNNDVASYTISNIRTVTTQSADFDLDHDVDGDDFLIWQAGFGTGTTHEEGDADGDGDVDGDDFLDWQAQFGSGSGSASAAVPEPACIMLMVTLLVACFCPRTSAARSNRNYY